MGRIEGFNTFNLWIETLKSALYLGRKISELYQKVLVEIAKEKSIPVYKMDFNEKNRTYNLRKIKYIGE